MDLFKKISSMIFILLLTLLYQQYSIAQNPTYEARLKNDVQVDGKNYEFEIWLFRTGSTPWELGGFQAGLMLNDLVLNGGTLSATYIAGTTDAAIVASGQTPANPNVASVDGGTSTRIFKLAAKLPTGGAGTGAIISAVAPVRLGRFRITNTVVFAIQKANIAWNFSATSPYYPTKVNAYVASTNTDVTVQASHFGTYSVDLVNPTLPVELASLTATVNNLNADLKWSTATEVNNYGFEIERRTVSDQLSAVSNWQKIGFVNGNGTSNAQHLYSFSDNITESGNYAYRLKQIDNNGTFKYSQELAVTIAVPKVFSMNQNYPNPFNPTTNIEFTVATDGKAVLKVYNTLGQEVAVLYNGTAQAGRIIQTHFDASRLASGIYFSRLEADGKSLVKRMMFIK